MYVCTCIHTYICIYVCMHVHILVFASFKQSSFVAAKGFGAEMWCTYMTDIAANLAMRPNQIEACVECCKGSAASCQVCEAQQTGQCIQSQFESDLDATFLVATDPISTFC